MPLTLGLPSLGLLTCLSRVLVVGGCLWVHPTCGKGQGLESQDRELIKNESVLHYLIEFSHLILLECLNEWAVGWPPGTGPGGTAHAESTWLAHWGLPMSTGHLQGSIWSHGS